MKITTVTLGKHFKLGLPNFSNITTSVSCTWEVGEKEEFDFAKGWDVINHELSVQGNDTDQSWLRTQELKDKYKVTVTVPKEVHHDK